MCVAAVTRLPFFGGELLPKFREGHFVLQVSHSAGHLPAGDAASRDPDLAGLAPERTLATVEQQVGRAELGEDPWGPHRSEFHVELKPIAGKEEEKVEEELNELLKKIPGIQFEVLTFLGDRIGETLTGETAPVVVNIFGDDLDLLDAKAQEVANVLKSVSTNANANVKSPPGAPRMAVRLRPDRLTQFGFRPVEVLEAIQTSYQGTVARRRIVATRSPTWP